MPMIIKKTGCNVGDEQNGDVDDEHLQLSPSLKLVRDSGYSLTDARLSGGCEKTQRDWRKLIPKLSVTLFYAVLRFIETF